MSSLKNIAKLLEAPQSTKEMMQLLKGLLTQKEIEEIAIRIEIVKMLKKHMPQHVIAKKLGVGVATVTRGAKEIKMGHFTLVKE